MKPLDALPDSILTLSIPGSKEEAAQLQELLPVLLNDALYDFDRCRREPEGYVVRMYPNLSAKEQEEKVQELRKRLQAAHALHNVVLHMEVNPL